MRTLFGAPRTAQNQNSVHPPHPRHVIVLVTALMMLSVQSAKAQLREYGTYAVAMKAYLNRQWTAERAEYTAIQRGKGWNMVPSFGIVFGLPTVSLNTGQIAAYKQYQGETKAKLKSLDLRYELLLNEALNGLRIEVEKAKNEEAKLVILANTATTREILYKIHKEAYEKKESKPIDYYSEKLLYLNSIQAYQLAVKACSIVVLEVEKLAHYNMPTESITYDGDTASEGSSSPMEVAPNALRAERFIKTSRRGPR